MLSVSVGKISGYVSTEQGWSHSTGILEDLVMLTNRCWTGDGAGSAFWVETTSTWVDDDEAGDYSQ